VPEGSSKDASAQRSISCLSYSMTLSRTTPNEACAMCRSHGIGRAMCGRFSRTYLSKIVPNARLISISSTDSSGDREYYCPQAGRTCRIMSLCVPPSGESYQALQPGMAYRTGESRIAGAAHARHLAHAGVCGQSRTQHGQASLARKSFLTTH
jgi:hypothetical protein